MRFGLILSLAGLLYLSTGAIAQIQKARLTRPAMMDLGQRSPLDSALIPLDSIFHVQSRAAQLRMGDQGPFQGDLFAAGVLAENGLIAVLLDDPTNQKNIFTFDGAFQDGGDHWWTEVGTSLGAFRTSVGSNLHQITIAAATNDGSDWLPVGVEIDQFPGQFFTTLRMDVGMRAADFFNEIPGDAPVQAHGVDLHVVNASMALFRGSAFLGSVPLLQANFSNGLAGLGIAPNAAGAGVSEVQMLFIVRETPRLQCPEETTVRLWPPNHKMHEIALQQVVPTAQPGSFRVLEVTQDEPVYDNGARGADAELVGDDIVLIRAERSGQGNGRVYNIRYEFGANGEACESVVRVIVPHDEDSESAEDDGQVYKSDIVQPIGDITGDGLVDMSDLASMLSQWDSSPPAPGDAASPADFNEDGFVDAVDLAVLIAAFSAR